ncbi:hypothetical protein TspCOW1_21590 [Thiohalobacter sp. COW1]|uniref:hypothetical protein n=1 Tax=Thiohalobacter sp. COW1 TaxID=2795687 RepID=UPI001915638C|nr:hypothetical protein [Thiohalobacter sp. COW1]BCO32056.1 hypothetical protein TspCOW1_21590 [Thiohalobacter sp. COW1]
MTLPCFLDFEASSLGVNSYPIQVAWSRPEGDIECWLISPAGIPEWDDWDPNAQAVHQIRREQLLEHGQPPAWVAARMNDQLAGQVVYAGAAYDSLWLQTLFEFAEQAPRFALGDYWGLIHDLMPASVTRKYGWATEWGEAAWRRTPGRRHDAGNDVQQMIELYRMALTRGRANR